MASARSHLYFLSILLFFLLYQTRPTHASPPLAISKRALAWGDINLQNIMDETLFDQHRDEVDKITVNTEETEDREIASNGWNVRTGNPRYPTVLVGGVPNDNYGLQLLVVFPKHLNSMYWEVIPFYRLTVILGTDDEFENHYRETRQVLLEKGKNSLQKRLKAIPNSRSDGIIGGGKPVGIIYAPNMFGEQATRMETMIRRLKTNVQTILGKFKVEIDFWHVSRFGIACNTEDCDSDSDSDSEDEDEDEDDDCIFSDDESDEPDMTEDHDNNIPGPNNDGVGDAGDDGNEPLPKQNLAIAYRQINKEERLWEWTMYFGSVDGGRTPAITPRQFTYIKRKMGDPIGE